MSKIQANFEAEGVALGCVLKDDRLARTCGLQPTDFHNADYRLVFEAAQSVVARRQTVDIVTVGEELRRQGRLDAIGGVVKLAEIEDMAATTVGFSRYCEILRDLGQVRRYLDFGTSLATKAMEADVSPSELQEMASAELQAILGGQASGMRPVSEAVSSFWDDFTARAERGPAGWSWGWEALDGLIGRVTANRFFVLGGAPGMGKSALAMYLAGNVALAGGTVAIFSLEMLAEQLVERWLASQTNVGLRDMRTGRVQTYEWRALSDSASRMSQLPLFFDDRAGQSLGGIQTQARRLALQQGPIALLIVDYLQLVTSEAKTQNREQEVAKVSHGLRDLAKELRCTMLCLAQPNRAPNAREDKRPMMSDLRESGAIEQDADAVLFIYRDEVYNKESEDAGVAEIIARKNRHGELGTLKIGYRPETQQFYSLEG